MKWERHIVGVLLAAPFFQSHTLLPTVRPRWVFRFEVQATQYMKIPDVSHLAPDVANTALALSLEWGKNWLAPIQERVRAEYPVLTASEADALQAWCEEVRAFAFAVVEKAYPQEMELPSETAINPVREKYPVVDEENLRRLYNQGMYYAWHG